MPLRISAKRPRVSGCSGKNTVPSSPITQPPPVSKQKLCASQPAASSGRHARAVSDAAARMSAAASSGAVTAASGQNAPSPVPYSTPRFTIAVTASDDHRDGGTSEKQTGAVSSVRCASGIRR